MQINETAASRTCEDVADAIRAFGPADWVRLQKTAAFYAGPKQINEEELLQEALARCLETRRCPENVTVAKFVAEAIRSIAYDTAQKSEHKVVLLSVPKTGDWDAALAVSDEAPTIEMALIERESAETLWRAVLALFQDDELARDIVEGAMVGMEAIELRELTGLDQTAYNSKRKLIRRRIDKAFPQGWKS